MNTNILLKKINAAFLKIDMPDKNEMLFHEKDRCQNYLLEEIEELRGGVISLEEIRILHQDMSTLSAKAWLWILPHYLRSCLTPEAEYSQMEIEYLIYSLSPTLKFESDVISRLSLLDKDQIECLIDFINWCSKKEFWNEYCPSDIFRAKVFLTELITQKYK